MLFAFCIVFAFNFVVTVCPIISLFKWHFNKTRTETLFPQSLLTVIMQFLDTSAIEVHSSRKRHASQASSYPEGTITFTSSSSSDEAGSDKEEASASSSQASSSSSSPNHTVSSSHPRGSVQRKFRVCSKSFALTYPQCPVVRTEFDPIFLKQFEPSQFASAREQHQDGSYHLHVFVSYISRINVRSARHFDVSIAGQTYHPNTQACRDTRKWLRYISKGSDHGVDALRRMEDQAINPLDYPIGKRKQIAADLQWSAQYRQLAALADIRYPITLKTSTAEYCMPKPDPRIKKRSWWIVAAPNAGKTRWVNRCFAGQRIYCPRMGKYPFEGYLDQDIIIYDDRKSVSFEEFSDVLNTWNIVHPVYGEVRFLTQNWKVDHCRAVIVLSNKTIEESMPQEDWLRMKKRFIQIVNPTLIPPEELSDDDLNDQITDTTDPTGWVH